SRAEPAPLDVHLDLVLPSPDLDVRLEIDQGRIHLIEDNTLATLAALDGVELTLENVTGAQLLAQTGPGVGPGVLLLIHPLLADLAPLVRAGHDPDEAGIDQRAFEVPHEGGDRDVFHGPVAELAHDHGGG